MRAFNEIVRRHEALRTTFAVVAGHPLQLVSPLLKIAMRVVDLTNVAPNERQREAMRCGAAEVGQPFDLQRGPLVRAALLRLQENECVLLVIMHHIVSDGWSIGVLLDELEVLYEAFSRGRPSPLPELPLQYGDYAVWQHDWLQGETLREQLAYWRERLAGAPLTLDLPTDRPRPPSQTFRGAYQTLSVPAALTSRIRILAETESVTLFMVILAALKMLLCRLSGQEDVCVGTPIAGRSRVDTEPLIGFFLNNLVLRTDLSGNPTFRELLRRVRDTALGAFAHQYLPFEKLLAELNPPRDPSRTPLFQVFLNVLNLAEERLHLPEAVAKNFSLAGHPPANERLKERRRSTATDPEVWSQFDLTLYVGERDGLLQFMLIYNVDLFDGSRAAELLGQLTSLLAECAEHPEREAGRHSLVTDSMRRSLPDPSETLDDTWVGGVHELFAAQAQRAPHRIAVSDPGETWTYAELDARSNQLAHRLCRDGVGLGDIVAIYGTRNATLVWALIGVLKAGAAFTILDPAYPPARLVANLRLASPRAVVQIGQAGPLPPLLEAFLLDDNVRCRVTLPNLEAARRECFLAEWPASIPAVLVGPDTRACVGFTSGSTGVPKGIAGRHGPLTHFLPWLAATFSLAPNDRFSMLSGLSHDPLQREIFTPLCLGATICVPSADDFSSGARLVAWAARESITVAHLTPALGQLLAQGGDAPNPTPDSIVTLRLAFFVGDILTLRDVERLTALAPALTCVNYYGSTETQRAVGYYVVPQYPSGQAAGRRATEVVPAGRGIRDVQLLIMNAAGDLCGVGELGEIYVRSPHLAEGYLGDSRLTAERFISNAFSAGQSDRLYRTGDLGRYLPDGNVAFAGRRDAQVKIRGFRIEVSEVEAVIARHDSVRDVAVIAREHASGDRQLIAYVVPRAETFSSVELREFVSGQLPSYMLPAHVVVLPALPLSPNGKVDRQALPAPSKISSDAGRRRTAPRSVIESEVAAIWRELLELETVDVHERFFEAGGHSLLSTQLLARVRSRFSVDVSLADFFKRPTVAGLASAIEEARQVEAPVCAPIEPAPRIKFRVPVGGDGRPIVPAALRTSLLSLMRATSEH